MKLLNLLYGGIYMPKERAHSWGRCPPCRTGTQCLGVASPPLTSDLGKAPWPPSLNLGL